MSDMRNIDVRELDQTDIDELLLWRMEVLSVVFADDVPWDAAALSEANRKYFERNLGSSNKAVIASLDGDDVGCGCLCLQEEMPSPDNPSGKCAYLMNIYTRPSARHHGVAERVVRTLIDLAKNEGAEKIYLEATSVGQPLYEDIGFRAMEGMMKL